ncbi:family 20 glycosylhydrolase [Rufibacter soli]
MALVLRCTSVPVPSRQTAPVALLPLPHKMQPGQGHFKVNQQTRIWVADSTPDLAQTAQYLSNTTGIPLQTNPGKTPGGRSILLKVNPALPLGPEGYRISVQPEGVVLEGKTNQGLFWAVQTLRQMLELPVSGTPNARTATRFLPTVEIQDEPAFGWRGLMLDVSRHFMDKDFLKRYIDLVSFYKLNTLHLHLTDDQGWRLEIPGYPKLTQVGAWRQQPDGSRHGGFYTGQDIKELVAYAKLRHVTIVPEIDMPGHVQAALASYPELSCTGGPFAVSGKAGVHPDILCAGNEKTYAFAAAVLTEVAALFPGQYLHLGGDEAPKDRWKACPRCQQRMQAEGLPNEEALQGYFTRRVLALARQQQKQVIAWDEVLKGGIGPETVIQAWHGPGAVKEALGKGAKVIVSPRSSFYLDLNSGLTSVAKVVRTPLIPQGVPVSQQAQVLGAEAALWTETIPQEKVDAFVFPRLLAFADNVWRNGAAETEDAFLGRIRGHYPYLQRQGVMYGFETWPVKVQPSYSPSSGAFSVLLQPGLPGLDLRYTLDGSVPGLDSPQYTGAPIQFASTATLQVVPFLGQRAWHEPVRASFVKHLALGQTPVLQHAFHPSYPGGGDQALTDGILGGEQFQEGFWQGFEKEDLELILDLEKERPLKEVSIRFLQDLNSWVFLPTQVELLVAGEDRQFRTVAKGGFPVATEQEKPLIKSFTKSLAGQPVRYLQIKAKNVGICPPGHPGAGGAAFLMTDEIIVQ